MADKETQRPVWVPIAIVAAVLIVALGVFAGPKFMSCTTVGNGIGICVGELLADIGISNQRVGPASTSVEEVAKVETPAIVVEPELELAEPAIDPETLVDVAPVAVIEPRLGLVRAEPDGSIVIAGSAAPGDEIEVYASGILLGRTTAESSGDWVLIPEAPLPVGGVEITVVVPGTGHMAAQSVVVVIQEDLSTEPLVVVSVPGQASQILQGLQTEAQEEVEEVVVATREVEDAQPADELPAAVEETIEELVVEAPVEVAVEEPPIEVAKVQEPAETISEPVEVEPVVEPEMAEETMTEEAMVEDTVVEETMVEETVVEETIVEETVVEEPAVEEERIEVAIADPVVEPEPAPTIAPLLPPSIDAIEIDGVRNFFAGAGAEAATIRLYVDDVFVADSVVHDGRWLVETAKNYLMLPAQRVRVDMLASGTAEVAARAEVNFEINLPEPEPEPVVEQPVVVAQAPEIVANEAAETINQAATDNAGAALAGAPTIVTETPVEMAEVEETPMVDDTEMVAEPEMAEEMVSEVVEEPMIESMPETKVATAEPVEEMAKADAPEMVEEMDADVPTLTAEPVGEPGAQRFASGKAIIRRGDNLWTIASRVYGSGYRYIAIYRANKGQIRNPDLIYPGQVFELPNGE